MTVARVVDEVDGAGEHHQVIEEASILREQEDENHSKNKTEQPEQ